MPREHINWAFNQCPPNLGKAVENIAAESEKSKYNPENDTNYCNLPMEMRLQCVKRMDFKTRCRFRRTSQAEKSLVDSKKYQFENFKIFYDQDFEWNVIVHEESGNNVRLVYGQSSDYGSIAAILKHAEVKNFKLFADEFAGDRVLPLLEHMAKIAPFGFERVAVEYNSSIGFFMKHCVNLKKVDFCAGYCEFPFKDMLEAPSLMNIKEFKFAMVSSEDVLEFLKGLVQKWIDNDVGVQAIYEKELKENGKLENAAEFEAEDQAIWGTF